MAAPVKLKAGQVTVVPLSAIEADPLQPRKEFSADRLNELANSLKSVGFMVPIMVRRGEKGAYVIVDGERRWRAAKLAKLKTVPVLLQDDSGDAAQRRVEQLAINNVRERLKPMELARMLYDLQNVEKLTPNDIAKRMSDAGFQMTRQETERLMLLPTLPAWTQAMIDSDALDAKGAALIVPVASNPTDKEVLPHVKKGLEHDIQWRGKVLTAEVARSIASAYRRVGIDLTRTGPYDGKDTVYFDHRKVCQSCDFYRRSGTDDAVCMSKDGFRKHQQEARDAGLLPGGKRPKRAPETPSEVRQEELEAKAASRERSHGERVAEYFDGWLRQSIGALLPTHADCVEYLRDYYARGMPDGYRIETVDAPTADDEVATEDRKIAKAGGDQQRSSRARQSMMAHSTRFTLSDFLGQPLSAEEKLEIAQCALASLLPRQVLELAHWLKFDIASSYRLDADYLNLKKRSQLEQLAAHAGITDLPAKVGELRSYLLQFENAQKIGLPPDLQLIAAAPIQQAESEDFGYGGIGSDDDDDDDDGWDDDGWDDEEDLEEAE